MPLIWTGTLWAKLPVAAACNLSNSGSVLSSGLSKMSGTRKTVPDRRSKVSQTYAAVLSRIGRVQATGRSADYRDPTDCASMNDNRTVKAKRIAIGSGFAVLLAIVSSSCNHGHFDGPNLPSQV